MLKGFRTRRCTIPFSILLLLCLSASHAVAQKRERRTNLAPPADLAGAVRRPGAAPTATPTPGAPTAAKSAAPGRPPMEIGDGISTAETTILLAPGESTYFRCQDEVTQLVFGDKFAYQVIWADEDTKRSDFYLIPAKNGVNTNLRVEMASGTVTVRLQTIALPKGGLRGGEYTNEVLVRPTGYRNELTKLKDQVRLLENTNHELTTSTQQATGDAERRVAAANEEAAARAVNTTFAVLRELAAGDGRKGAKGAGVELDGVRYSQASPVLRDAYGQFWLLVRVESRRKREKSGTGNIVIDRVEVGDRRNVRNSVTLPLVVAPSGTETIALMVEAKTVDGSSATKSAPDRVVITLAGGKAVTLKLGL